MRTLALVAAAATLAACGTVDNPRACNSTYPTCDDGFQCNQTTSLCVPKDGGAGGGGGSTVDVGRTDGGGDMGSDLGTGGATGGQDGGWADLRDAEGSCSTDQHCQADGLKVCVQGRCAGCRANTDCPMARPWCSATNSCESCQAANTAGQSVCAAPRPLCDPTSGACSECLQHTDCKDASKPLCGPARTCVPCNAGGGDPACAVRSPDSPRCGTMGTCVPCLASSDCKAATAPICAAEKCVPCTADAQCAMRDGPNPGLCLVRQGGRCATNAETVYVRNAAGCGTLAMANSGTPELPACDPQTGLARLSATKKVMLLRGGMPLDRLRIATGADQLSIIGQEGATILPGVGRGIELTAPRDLYIQGVTVAMGAAEGITAEGNGGILRLNRVIIRQNAKGGLVVRGGMGFEITNTVFDGNGPGTVGVATFGGVLLGPPAAGRPLAFRNNTVVKNLGPGVVCEGTGITLAGVLLHDNLSGDKVLCMLKPGTSTEGVPPQFASDYHLGPMSPCRDMGDMTDVPADDLDGDARPVGGRSDCGADEFRAP